MTQTDDNRVDALIKDITRSKPEFITDPDMDKLISVVLRLAMEIAVLRDKVSAQQTLLIQNNVLSSDDIDTYEPDADEAQKGQEANLNLIRAIISDLS